MSNGARFELIGSDFIGWYHQLASEGMAVKLWDSSGLKVLLCNYNGSDYDLQQLIFCDSSIEKFNTMRMQWIMVDL